MHIKICFFTWACWEHELEPVLTAFCGIGFHYRPCLATFTLIIKRLEKRGEKTGNLIFFCISLAILSISVIFYKIWWDLEGSIIERSHIKCF